MDSASNPNDAHGSSRIAGSGGAQIDPGVDYAGGELTYFDQGVQGHPINALQEGHAIPQQTQSGLPGHTGSPPPNSATTSGSTSTSSPNSPHLGGAPGEGHAKNTVFSADYSSDQLGVSGVRRSWGNSGCVHISRSFSAQSEEHSYSQLPGDHYHPSALPSAIKLLVSNNGAGSIIGRSGQTISELQGQSSARIKLSQTGDYYPGTQDRVCLVQGQIENVKTAVRLLLERLYMLQEQQHSQHLAWQPKPNETLPAGFDFVVRLLVPSSSCGMIIGKAGSNIKHLEETSGVSSVRLSPKEKSDQNSPTAAVVAGTAERVVTLTGPTMESCLTCLHIVLDGMMAHHEICRYSNMTTSYSRVMVPSSFSSGHGVPQGSHVMVIPPGAGSEPQMWDPTNSYGQFGKRSASSPDLNAPQILWDPLRPTPTRMPPDGAPSPTPRQAPREPMQQFNPGFNEAQPSFPQHEMPPMMHSPGRGPPSNTGGPPLYMMPTPSPNPMEQAAMHNSSSAPDLLAMQLQDSLRINSSPATAPVDYTHFAPQLPQPTPAGFTAQVLVPDTLIGSILGRGGRTLNELQMHSNTRIRISQRGEYVPGTRNRIVTIRGPNAQSVSLAQYLMSQRMVLPPTASYSPQGPYPPPLPSQLPPQPRHTIQHPIHYSGAPDSFQAHAFQEPDGPRQHPSATASGTPSRSSSNKDLSHP